MIKICIKRECAPRDCDPCTPKPSWAEHVACFRKNNPTLTLKEALKAASKTYRK